MSLPARLMIFVAVLAIPVGAHATEAYKFASAVVQSLSTCKDAFARLHDAQAPDNLSMMKNITVFDDEVRQADSFISPFTKSENKMIQQSASSYSSIYQAVIANDKSFLDLIERAMKRIKGVGDK